MKSRIWFEGNPWPNGHAIQTAELFIDLSEGKKHSWPPEAGAFLGLNIKTDNYYAEMSDDEQKKAYETAREAYDNNAHIADWNSYIAWQNFHSCTIKSSNAQIGTRSHPYDLTTLKREKLIFETGRKVVADQESDLNAFTCYILGHDSVSDHQITFSETIDSHEHFDIKWTGSVALSYSGDDNFTYRFRAELTNVPFLGIKGLHQNLWQNRSPLFREKALRELASSCLSLEHKDFVFQSKESFDWLVPETIQNS